MPSEVKITLSADDKASAKIKGVTNSLGGISKVMQSEALKSVGKDVSRYMNMATDAMKDLVTEYGNYAEVVKRVSRLSGANMEQASKLIQLSDDLRISQEDLTTAMQAAARKGIDVSTDSLARMSDVYLKLAPGLERSKYLMDNFGRSGMNMAPFMDLGSDAIRRMSAEVDKNLIVTDKQYQKFREGYAAVDEFNDRIQGLRYSLATDLVNAFTALPEPMQNFALGLAAIQPQLSGGIQLTADLTATLTNLGVLFRAGGLLSSIPVLLGGIGAAAAAAVAPFLPLIAAIGLLIVTLQKFGERAWQTILIIGDLIRALDRLRIARAEQVDQRMQNSPYRRASGGPVSSSVPYIVGERGPELFVPSSGGTIIPNNRVGGASMTVNFVYSPAVSLASQAEAQQVLLPIIREAMRGA
jgi:hypothetical protein